MARVEKVYPFENGTIETDEKLVELAKNGDKKALDFLLHKYKELVNIKISKYFIIGAEKDDIFQEGMIGLYKAIKSFNDGKENSFKSFANLCIERQLITAIKTSNRQKNMPLNLSISLNANAYDENDDGGDMLEVFDSNTSEDPLEMITKKEYYKMVETKIQENLSDFEKQVLDRYAMGESYNVIAQRLSAPVKSIDNAIQRIRKKAVKNNITEN